MGDDTSVRTANLSTYSETASGIEQTLSTQASQLTGSYKAFQIFSGVTVANPTLMLALEALQNDLVATRRFVELVHDAVVAADVSDANGVSTIPAPVIDKAMSTLADERGWDLSAMEATPVDYSIPANTTGTIPQDSGYVDDPVCTATGHFLEDEIDLVMPDRLAHLAWPRRYSSRQLDTGAHGRGWWSWADARCETGDGLVVVVGPDGRNIAFVPGGPGEAWTTTGIDATLRATDDGHVLTFGPRAAEGHEIWTFDAEGRIRSTDGPRRGTTTFEHRDGRLRAVRHGGGRTLDVVWSGDRIAEIHASDGRTARYRYDDAGDLVAVERALGDTTYEPGPDGRIVRVIDADGVVLCVNEYDELGRVAVQHGPTGRVSRFRYEPGLRTVVVDGDDQVVAVYVHDAFGRVVQLIAPGGASVLRRFDADGVVIEQRAQDGSSFTARGSGAAGGTMQVSHADGRVEWFRYDDLGRLAETSVDDTEPTRLTYDGSSFQPSHVSGPLGWTLDWRWRADGALLGTTDADGVAVTFDVDADGLPEAIAVPGLDPIRIDRHPTGSPSRIVLPDGGVASTVLDDAGRPLAVESAGGATNRFEYSAAGRLAAVESPSGGRVEITYGSNGLVETVRDPLGRVVTYETDRNGRATSITDEDGASWQLDYSPLGILTSITDPNDSTWTCEVDARHRVAASEDPLGRRTEVDRDTTGRITRIEGPAERWEATFDRGAMPATITTAPGGTTVVERDERQRITAVRDADGVERRYEWTPANRLAAVRTIDWSAELTYGARGDLRAARIEDRTGGFAPIVRDWAYDVDWRGNVRSTRSPEGRVSSSERDADGRSTVRAAGNASSTIRYDVDGRPIDAVGPSGVETAIERDAVGRAIAVTRPGGGTSRYTHDGEGRVLTDTDPLGGSARLTYDAAGNLLSRTDQLDRTSTYRRRADGSLAATELPDGTMVEYGYDAVGRLATIGTGSGTLLGHEYGPDRLLSAVVEVPRWPRTDQTHTAAGRLRTARDTDGETEWSYDLAGRVVARRGTALPDATWSHRPDGWDATVDGRTVTVSSDLDGLVTDLRLDAAGVEQRLGFRRDETGQVVDTTLPDGRTLDIERDRAGRVVVVRGGAHGHVRYAYDDAGRLASMIAGDIETTWTYDSAGRLVGERTGDAERTYTYDAGHQLRVVDGPDGRVEIDYDACGRRVAERSAGRTRRYEWDAIGRLTAVIDDGERLDVDIDGFGLLRRVGGSEVRWDRSGPAPVPASIDGRALVCIGRRIVADGDRLLTDGLLGSTGTSPWGHASMAPEVQTDVGVPGGLGFAGLVWLGARVYDPATRQFLTPDPLAGSPTSPAGAFPYGYADLDPVNRCDPFGTNGQPIGLDDFQAMKDRATSIQWANIAEVGLIIGGAVLMGALAATGVGLPLLIAAGAVVGATSAAVPSIMRGEPASTVLTNAAFGALAGGLSGGFGPRIPPGAVQSVVSMTGREVAERVAADAAAGAVTSGGVQTVREGYDALGLPGGDGSFDQDAILRSALTGGVSGGVTTRTFLNQTGGRPVLPAFGPGTTSPRPPTAMAPDPPTASPLLLPETPTIQLRPSPDGWGSATPGGLLSRDRTLLTPDHGPLRPGWGQTDSGLLHGPTELQTLPPPVGATQTDTGIWVAGG